jgi:hypothetical protein
VRHPYDDMRSTSPLAMMIDRDASAISHESPYRSIDPMRPERREPVAPPKRGTSGVYELPDPRDVLAAISELWVPSASGGETGGIKPRPQQWPTAPVDLPPYVPSAASYLPLGTKAH